MNSPSTSPDMSRQKEVVKTGPYWPISIMPYLRPLLPPFSSSIHPSSSCRNEKVHLLYVLWKNRAHNLRGHCGANKHGWQGWNHHRTCTNISSPRSRLSNSNYVVSRENSSSNRPIIFLSSQSLPLRRSLKNMVLSWRADHGYLFSWV